MELVQDGNVTVHFYNLDFLTTDEMLMKDAVHCAVSGGHQELIKKIPIENWEIVTKVILQQNPNVEVWRMPKITGGYSSQIVQTRTTYNVIYDVEGNLTCHDTLGKNLVSNTILLQPKDSASVLVKLQSNKPLPRIESILKDYVQCSSSTLKPRLMNYKNGTNSELSLRMIYSKSSAVPDEKVVTDVSEWSKFIASRWNFTVESVRGTRFCHLVKEGNFTWSMTAAGVTTTPKNYCLDVDGMPVPKRKCIGDYFQGVYWDSPPRQPPVCLDPFERSTLLKNLTNSLDRKNVLEELSNEISEGGNLSSVEIYFVSKALEKAAEEVSNGMGEISSIKTETIGRIVNSILHSGSEAVKSADESYGSSKLILEAVEKLLQASASPMPTPISLSHFSAFASVAGTGIRGFNYSVINGIGKMETLADPQHGPTIVTCTYNNGTNVSTIATYYNNGCLFSAANSDGRSSLGPVFGMKMFGGGGETSEEQQPVHLTIVFTIEKKNETLRCASWNPSIEGGWSTAGCYVLNIEDTALRCSCTLLKSVETFFTFIDSGELWKRTDERLAILPLRNNVGALLHLYIRKRRKIYGMEKKINCTAKRYEEEESIHFTKISEFSISFVHKVIIFSLSFSSDGEVQCRFGDTLNSNKCLLLVHNRAIVKLRAQNPMNIVEKLQKYTIKHDLKFNITKMPREKDPHIEIFLVSHYAKKEHLKFIEEVEQAFNDMSALYNFTLVDVTSNRLCLMHEEGGFLWPNTKLKHHATPINPCLDENGVPTPTRVCEGDHLKGMYWGQVPERPKLCNRPSNKTQKLHDIIKNEEKDIIQDLSEMFVKEETDITTFKAVTDILQRAAEETTQSNSKPKTNITSLVTLVNKMVMAELESPKEYDELQGSSEIFLDAVDKLLEKTSSDNPEPVSLPHFAAVAASPKSKLRGFVALAEESPGVATIENVSWSDSMPEVLQKSLSAGAVLLEAPKDVGVTFSVFKNSSIFKGDKDSDLVLDTPVLGFNMFQDDKKELSKAQNTTILIFFLQSNATSSKNRGCYYWDPKAKKWSKEGLVKISSCNYEGEIPQGVDVCMSTHLTHFAMLLSTNESVADDDLLHLLTLVGCSISLFCLIGIFVMALISSKWRHGASKKVQINLSASLTMMMACYLAIAAMGECPKSLAWCIALGALMHYSVIAAFTWMVIVAVLQLLRLTPNTSIDSRRLTGSHLVLKTCIFGWGLPLLPVAGTLGTGLDNYERRLNSALCYPSGRLFYIVVFFPIALAVTINMIVFIWLMNILFCSKMKVMRVHQKSQAVRRVFSAMFLFCLLGIAWVSGIFVEITLPSEKVSNALTYLFCITATLQGASLFIFFVACDREVGNKMKGAMSSLTSGKSKFRFQNLHSSKLDSSSSEKTNTTMELSLSTLQKKKKRSFSSISR
ncbi:hypothetical protein J437_LFUL017980 [Ladona fulva]|uniref:G-protein coupled receptors family 2 profile 2 domain-containing protein n=1 Tax=Ladona fulva TaxID=123851 RepID=A0A8K0KJA2_LADFU|nr:hypothetical protein J437_LFUL017980 [Ladona fulva]